MEGSSYYSSLMTSYAQSKRSIEEKKILWEKYLEKLNSFGVVLTRLNSSVISCKSSLLGGGYLIGEGVSLDEGKLQEASSTLENDCTTLSTVITYTEQKIQEFTNEIQELTNLYNQAYANYKIALANERAAS